MGTFVLSGILVVLFFLTVLLAVRSARRRRAWERLEEEGRVRAFLEEVHVDRLLPPPRVAAFPGTKVRPHVPGRAAPPPAPARPADPPAHDPTADNLLMFTVLNSDAGPSHEAPAHSHHAPVDHSHHSPSVDHSVPDTSHSVHSCASVHSCSTSHSCGGSGGGGD